MEQQNNNTERYTSSHPTIRKYFKEEEIAQLTDEEYEILKAKVIPPQFKTAASFNVYVHDFHNGVNANGLKGDDEMLNVYKRFMASYSLYSPCVYRYSRAFTLCHFLGVNNIYDIGCGNQLQAFLLMYAPNMNYTGIDRDIFHDYSDEFIADTAYINDLFTKFTGSDKIKYINEAYPCDLTTVENNIAICMGIRTIGDAMSSENKDVVTALARDFERIVFDVHFNEYNLTGMDIKDVIYNDVVAWVNPYEKHYELWKKAMPDYEFYKLGERYIFGTKIAEDREKLERNYTVIDNQIMTGAIDAPFFNHHLIPIK